MFLPSSRFQMTLGSGLPLAEHSRVTLLPSVCTLSPLLRWSLMRGGTETVSAPCVISWGKGLHAKVLSPSTYACGWSLIPLFTIKTCPVSREARSSSSRSRPAFSLNIGGAPMGGVGGTPMCSIQRRSSMFLRTSRCIPTKESRTTFQKWDAVPLAA